MTAKQIAAAIKDNVDALYADDISHDAFDTNARRLWALAESSPRRHKAVTRMVREQAGNDWAIGLGE